MHPSTRRPTLLATAVVTALAGGTADSAVVSLQLTQVQLYSNSGPSTANITSSTASFDYNDVTSVLSQTGGTFNARFTITPTTTLFRHSITGLVIGNAAAAGAASFVCAEGNFGAGVGASICGNYNFGANFVNQSTVSWGPGTATSRTIGGDDGALGAQQSIADYDLFNTVSWNGTTLVIANTRCGAGTACAPSPTANGGFAMTLQAIPVPAAAWLFGGALGALGFARRRTTG
jgi:hypothetical protein